MDSDRRGTGGLQCKQLMSAGKNWPQRWPFKSQCVFFQSGRKIQETEPQGNDPATFEYLLTAEETQQMAKYVGSKNTPHNVPNKQTRNRVQWKSKADHYTEGTLCGVANGPSKGAPDSLENATDEIGGGEGLIAP